MSTGAVRTIATAHGLLAWLSIAITAAAAWLVWRQRRPHPKGQSGAAEPANAPLRRLAITAAALATSLMTATGALGLLLHDPYQRRLRQRIFVQSPRIGWLFERKEHLAFGAVLLSLCALAALGALELRARRRGASSRDEISRHLHRAAVRAYTTSAFLAAVAAAASAIVAHHHSF